MSKCYAAKEAIINAARQYRFFGLLPLLCCLPMQFSARVDSAEATTATELLVPYLTTRAYELGDDGEIDYSTDLSETSGGRCVIKRAAGKGLDVRNGSVKTLPVDNIMASFGSTGGNILVYVHGYNIGLERACRDAAQLAYQTGFENRILLFSWPASRTLLTYFKDERRLAASMPAILQALEDLGERYGHSNVSIVAHSMGSRVALASIDSTPPERRFNDLILIAPDINREVFLDAVPALQQRVRSISVLASKDDKLLMLSQTVNRGERLGQVSDFAAAGVNVVDISALEDLGFTGHIYHLENGRVGEILRQILETDPDS